MRARRKTDSAASVAEAAPVLRRARTSFGAGLSLFAWASKRGFEQAGMLILEQMFFDQGLCGTGG